MSVPDTVVFDIGGVLIDWDPRYLYRQLLTDEAEVEWFLANVCTPAWNEEMDAGRPQSEALASLLDQWPDHTTAIEAWHSRWPEMMRGPIAGSVALLTALDTAGVPLYAATNWSADTFHHALEQFDFLQRFRGILVSGDEGVRKPWASYFALLTERFGIDPARTLFIDDNADNVVGAAECGFDTVRFVTPDGLRRALWARGLLDHRSHRNGG